MREKRTALNGVSFSGVILSRRSAAKDPEVASRKGAGCEEEKVRSQNWNSEVRKEHAPFARTFSLLNSGF
jgi:hypothetical protein